MFYSTTDLRADAMREVWYACGECRNGCGERMVRALLLRGRRQYAFLALAKVL